MKKIILIISLLINVYAKAQTEHIVIHPYVRLLNDSVESKQLIADLSGFLLAAEKPNEENKFVLPAQKIETFILLDEIIGMEKSGKYKDDHFYKPHLTNVISLNDNKYLLQVSNIGGINNEHALIASFELIAHKINSSFLFSSPLIDNTKNWKVEKNGNTSFHYQYSINKTKTEEYCKLASAFDTKLKSVNKITDFYCCENFTALLKLIGVDYKIYYNGMTENTLSSNVENRKLIVLGNNNATFNEFDPHDLWHDRLSLVISRSLVNKPIDEACAYVYGGSWGISWVDIFKTFKLKVANNKNIDWKDVKENPINFAENKRKDLMADYVVNALIIKKTEKEKGFSAVWEFLNCGKYEKGNDNYYKALEKLTGITKDNYNQKVWELINNEQK